MLNFQQPLKHRPKSRVELHVHLDGAIRYETAWELMRRKGLKLPGSGSLEDLKFALQVQEPHDLEHFLKAFDIYLPAFIGDLDAIERIAYEFVEDQARQSVAYCEVRFSPHLLLPAAAASCTDSAPHHNGSINHTSHGSSGENTDITSDDVLKAVLKGLARGDQVQGTKTRVILSCIRGITDAFWDVLRLCEEYRDRGVVGIDVAGNSLSVIGDTEIKVFQSAKEKGIHRTVHAGESEPANSVKVAMEVLGAERIGHGYRVLEDEDIYQQCLRENIHFEVCPHSSYNTGTVQHSPSISKRHPLFRFAEDGVSFSISSDDPTITNTRLTQEYQLLTDWGFTEAHIARANFQAALHSFLPPEEKKELIESLQEAYGVVNYAVPSSPANLSSSTSTQPVKPSITLSTWAERA